MIIPSPTPVLSPDQRVRYYQLAFILSLLTIFFNLFEGAFSTWLGFRDETLALFGFGIDSFIEVISAIGIAQMVLRIRRNPDSPRAPFEKRALQITGISFYLLVAGLLISTVMNIVSGHKPESTFWGIVISLISIMLMAGLIAAKTHVGKKLGSAPILADANCTRACIYMSLVLLASSLVFQFTGFGWLDSLGTLGIAWYAFNEGRESLEKARGKSCDCEEHCSADDPTG